MEVVEIVQRVGDVVGDVHHRAFDGLPPGLDQRIGVQDLGHLPGVEHVGRELAGSQTFVAAPAAFRRHSGVAGVRTRDAEAAPWVLQHGGPDRSRQIQPLAAGPVDVDLGDDPERLGVALEPVRKTEPRTGDPVQHPLAEVTERRMAQIVSRSGRLDHHRVASAERLEQLRRAGRA